MIDLRLLGRFRALGDDGLLIRPPGRRSIALVCCLAVEPERWNRNRLAALLWPRRDLSQARASLRQEFLRIRSVFGQIFLQGEAPGSVPTLDRTCVTTDIARFREAAADPLRAIEAVALYRGDLLDGFQDHDNAELAAWLAQWRNHFRSEAVICLRRLLRSAEASEAVARRLVELAPDAEDAYTWLIRHYAETGDPGQATDTYQTCAASMRAAGKEPSASIQAMLAQALAQNWLPSPVSDAATFIRTVRESPVQVSRPDPGLLRPVTDRPSIVVLPFDDLSPGGASPFLADGMTEEMTSALSFIPGFFVCARHSAMAYRERVQDIRRIGTELGVRYALEGSLSRRNGGIRVDARLIDCATGLHLWADRQEASEQEMLDVRDVLVQALAGRLQPSLMTSEIRLALRRPATQLDAWGWLQRALGALLHLDDRHDALTQALAALREAIALDPEYAMALALLSAVYTWRTLSYAFPNADGERAEALRHAEKALRLDAENPFVLVHCAETAVYAAARIDDAQAMLETAVKRNPNDAHGVALLGNVRRFAGDDARTSLALISQAMRLSPRDPRSYTWLHYGSWCHWKLDELLEMEAASRRSVRLFPGYPHSWIALTCALGLQHKTQEAKEAGRMLRHLHPRFNAQRFYQTAERFYGPRFPGEISEEYRRLCAVLTEATDG